MFVISLRHHAHLFIFFFFFNDTATTEIYTLSLHDALPICGEGADHGEGEGDPGERAPRDRSREVEPDHLGAVARSEEHTSELQSQSNLVCRLLLEKKKKKRHNTSHS